MVIYIKFFADFSLDLPEFDHFSLKQLNVLKRIDMDMHAAGIIGLCACFLQPFYNIKKAGPLRVVFKDRCDQFHLAVFSILFRTDTSVSVQSPFLSIVIFDHIIHGMSSILVLICFFRISAFCCFHDKRGACFPCDPSKF